MTDPTSTNTGSTTAKVTLLKKALVTGIIIIVAVGAYWLMTDPEENDQETTSEAQDTAALDEDSDNDSIDDRETSVPGNSVEPVNSGTQSGTSESANRPGDPIPGIDITTDQGGGTE